MEESKKPDPKRLSPYELTEMLVTNNKFIKINDIPYVYDTVRGYYQCLQGTESPQVLRALVPDFHRVYITSRTIIEIVEWLKIMPIKDCSSDFLFHSCRYINFVDCVYDINTDQILDHSDSLILTSYNNVSLRKYNYIKAAPTFRKVLDNICARDKELELLLGEHFGFIISGVRNLKNFSVLYGPKDTGKSLWLNLLRMAVGDKFTSTIALQQLSDRFMTSDLIGKKLNVCGDLDRNAFDVGMLKRLTGGDPIKADIKHQCPIQFVNQAALVFGSNTMEFLTKSADPQNAVFERLILIPFTNTIPREKQISNLLINLEYELPYIIYHFAIPGIKRLIKQNNMFTPCKKASEIKLQMALVDKGIITFLVQCCQFELNLRCYIETLYNAYKNYCSNTGYPTANNRQFSKFVEVANRYDDTIPYLEKQKYRNGERYQYGFIGIDLKSDYESQSSLSSTNSML